MGNSHSWTSPGAYRRWELLQTHWINACEEQHRTHQSLLKSLNQRHEQHSVGIYEGVADCLCENVGRKGATLSVNWTADHYSITLI